MDKNGKLFKEIFGLISLVILPFDFTFNMIFSGQNIKDVWHNSWNNVVSGWNGGKSIDDCIFGKSGGDKNIITGQPGDNENFYTPTIGPEKTKYLKFDDLKSMVNFMWETSNKPDVDVEIVGYVLKDDDGNISYYVIDWTGNTKSTSNNPYYTSTNPKDQRVKFDGKFIVSQIHTHPSSYYESKSYDGNSYDDFLAAQKWGIPVYSIGSTSVSVITSQSTYKTKEDFRTLSENMYGFSTKLENRRKVNPFYLAERKSWLENPIITTAW